MQSQVYLVPGTLWAGLKTSSVQVEPCGPRKSPTPVPVSAITLVAAAVLKGFEIQQQSGYLEVRCLSFS